MPRHQSDTESSKSRQHLARELLNNAYLQWIDLASDNGPDHKDADQRRRLKNFWHDDDTPEHESNIVTPPLASECLLCFLLPTLALPTHSLLPITTRSHLNKQFALEARTALSLLTPRDIVPEPAKQVHTELTRILLDRIHEYYTNIKETGSEHICSFAGRRYYGSSLWQDHPEKADKIAELPVTDSYSLGLSVSLRVLRLLSQLERTHVGEEKHIATLIDRIRPPAKNQLSQAIQGLRSSFACRSIESGDWKALYGDLYDWDQIDSSSEMQALRNQLNHYEYNPTRANPFECGWSWGIVKPPDEGTRASHFLRQQDYYAVPEPYLYFTWIALAAVEDLSNNELRSEELIEDEDLRAVIELKELARLTNIYWSILATQQSNNATTDFYQANSTSRITDVPWKTTDRDESEYYTLYILGILYSSSGLGIDHKLATEVVEQLAQRGRISTRPLIVAGPSADQSNNEAEPTVRELHYPGKTLTLDAVNPNDELKFINLASWRIYDYAPLLLKVAVEIRRRTTDHETRQRTNAIIDLVLNHLEQRRGDPLEDGFGGLREDIPVGYGIWDDVSEYLTSHGYDNTGRSAGEPFRASWYLTERIIEALVLYLKSPPEKLPAKNTQDLLYEILGELNDRGVPTADLQATARHWPAAALSEALRRVDDEFDMEGRNT